MSTKALRRRMLALGLKPKPKTWERERRELVIVACTGFVILFSLGAIIFLIPLLTRPT